jgi:uncharacterized protein YeaO (DUF488 family)
MMKTRCLYDPPDLSDGERVLVTRFWPRGTSRARLCIAEWMKVLAPSATLLSDWRNGRISWEEYEDRYRAEMASQGAVIATLAFRARHSTVTLLCYEREGDPHCHRYLLKKLIEATGFKTSQRFT